MTVAALFIDPHGPYPELLGADMCWDEERDASTYSGPWPVIAHPPCNMWVNMAGHNYIRYTRERGKPQPHLRPGNDGGRFAAALRSVCEHGGVLEHPAGSHAWSTFGLQRPKRGMWTRVDAVGMKGVAHWVTEVSQSAYGHSARKRTWLYLVTSDIEPPCLDWSDPEGSHQIGWYDRAKPTLSKRAASITPVEFAQLLAGLAELGS